MSHHADVFFPMQTSLPPQQTAPPHVPSTWPNLPSYLPANVEQGTINTERPGHPMPTLLRPMSAGWELNCVPTVCQPTPTQSMSRRLRPLPLCSRLNPLFPLAFRQDATWCSAESLASSPAFHAEVPLATSMSFFPMIAPPRMDASGSSDFAISPQALSMSPMALSAGNLDHRPYPADCRRLGDLQPFTVMQGLPTQPMAISPQYPRPPQPMYKRYQLGRVGAKNLATPFRTELAASHLLLTSPLSSPDSEQGSLMEGSRLSRSSSPLMMPRPMIVGASAASPRIKYEHHQDGFDDDEDDEDGEDGDTFPLDGLAAAHNDPHTTSTGGAAAQAENGTKHARLPTDHGQGGYQSEAPSPQSSTKQQSTSRERVFECTFPGCKKRFPRRYNLKSHERTHTTERPFVCDLCCKSFARNHDLKRHRRIHLGLKPYQCQICRQLFSRADALTRHRINKPECRICE